MKGTEVRPVHIFQAKKRGGAPVRPLPLIGGTKKNEGNKGVWNLLKEGKKELVGGGLIEVVNNPGYPSNEGGTST